MPLETATTIAGLNASYPAASDGLVDGDNHLRLIKAVLVNCLGQIDGPSTITHDQLNDLSAGLLKAAAGSAGAPSIMCGGDTTAGFYKLRTGRVGVSGGLTGPIGTTGQIAGFPKDPPAGWLLCDGRVLNITDYPDLAAYLGTTYGGNGVTTFGLPNYLDYYLRGSGVSAIGAALADEIKSHGHSGYAEGAGAHNHEGWTDNGGVDHNHGYTAPSYATIPYGYDGYSPRTQTGVAAVTGGASAYLHSHHFVTTTVGAHGHTVTVNATGGSETRPKSKIVHWCIKT